MKLEIKLNERKVEIIFDENEIPELEAILGINPLKKIVDLSVEQRFTKKQELKV